MIKKMRIIAMTMLCLVSLSWFMISNVSAASVVNMNAHIIDVGTAMYYWNGITGFSADRYSYMGLQSSFSSTSSVNGGYRDMSGSTDTIVATATGVVSYEFSKMAPSTSTYRLFTKNTGPFAIKVTSGYISYGQ